jgi:hypothetical protein
VAPPSEVVVVAVEEDGKVEIPSRSPSALSVEEARRISYRSEAVESVSRKV